MWFQSAGGRDARHEQRKDSKHETSPQANKRGKCLLDPQGFPRSNGISAESSLEEGEGEAFNYWFQLLSQARMPRRHLLSHVSGMRTPKCPSGSFKARKTPGEKQDTHTPRCEVVRLHLHPPRWSPGRCSHCICASSQVELDRTGTSVQKGLSQKWLVAQKSAPHRVCEEVWGSEGHLYLVTEESTTFWVSP